MGFGGLNHTGLLDKINSMTLRLFISTLTGSLLPIKFIGSVESLSIFHHSPHSTFYSSTGVLNLWSMARI